MKSGRKDLMRHILNFLGRKILLLKFKGQEGNINDISRTKRIFV